jgi:hypothetical protein
MTWKNHYMEDLNKFFKRCGGYFSSRSNSARSAAFTPNDNHGIYLPGETIRVKQSRQSQTEFLRPSSRARRRSGSRISTS